MIKKQVKQSLGDSLYLHKVSYEFEGETEPFTIQGMTVQHSLLRTLADNTELMNCGNGKFETLRIYHNGLKWIMELQRQDQE